jgi:hypothetical protein
MLLAFAVYSLLYALGVKEKVPAVIIFVSSAFLLFMLKPALLGIDLVHRYFEALKDIYVLANMVFVFSLAFLAAFFFRREWIFTRFCWVL